MTADAGAYSGATDQLHRFRMQQTWLEIKLTNGLDEPMAGEKCVLYPAAGEPLEHTLDDQGLLREEYLRPGKVVVEFPDLMETCRIEDGVQAEGPSRDNRGDRGKYETGPSDVTDMGSYSLDADDEDDDDLPDELDDDDQDDDDQDDDDQDDDVTLEPDIGGSYETTVSAASGRDWLDMTVTATPVDLQNDRERAYATATHEVHTGQSYHFAVLMCVAVEVHSTRLADETETLGFRLEAPSGEQLREDEVEDWFIFHDDVGMGDFQLTIAGETVPVPSVARASDAIVLSLDEVLEHREL